ncbi:hypothetical protein F5B20DRAFT_591031 [Whalleya microplaca]|nr:hypothetical protein F5B20DRAFT_591031 [Whalleya microplaca]
MRVLSLLIVAFSIAISALPIQVPKDRLLDNLPDTILNSVSDLLSYPKNPKVPGGEAADPLLCSYSPVFCLPTCATQCAGGAEVCATCFTNCSRTRGCGDGAVDSGKGKGKGAQSDKDTGDKDTGDKDKNGKDNGGK